MHIEAFCWIEDVAINKPRYILRDSIGGDLRSLRCDEIAYRFYRSEVPDIVEQENSERIKSKGVRNIQSLRNILEEHRIQDPFKVVI